MAAKAAALLHSLVGNHPIETVVLAAARGELAEEALAIWIRQRLVDR